MYMLIGLNLYMPCV